MTGWLQKLTQGGLVILLLVAISLGGYSSLLSHRLDLARRQSAEQQKTLAQQAKLITSLRTDDARNRAMMAEQQRREQQLRQRGEIYQRKYREAIQNDECSRRAAPVAVLDLLRGTDTAAASADHPVAP
jgi:predicted Holliday junction resolvase-like endonuclease